MGIIFDELILNHNQEIADALFYLCPHHFVHPYQLSEVGCF